jgi:uncharacterized protein YoxC
VAHGGIACDTALVAAHKQNEQRLTDEGKQLIQTAHSISADVEQLHMKIDRKSAVVSDNEQQLHSFQSTFNQRIAQATMQLEQFYANHNSKYQTLTNAIDVFVASHTSELAQFASCASDIKDTVVRHCESLTHLSQEHQSSIEQQTRQLDQSTVESNQQLLQCIHDYRTDLQQNVETLNSKFEMLQSEVWCCILHTHTHTHTLSLSLSLSVRVCVCQT